LSGLDIAVITKRLEGDGARHGNGRCLFE
jgi:hypothetical protein